jgi:hypothetical protein
MAEDADGQKPGEKKDTGKGEITMTQAEIDDMISARLTRERAIWERKVGVLAKEQEELEALRKEKLAREQKDAEAKGEWDRLKAVLAKEHETAIQEKQGKLDTATSELHKERVRSALVTEAAKQNAVDPEEIADLLERRVKLDDQFQVEVLDEQGKRAIGKGGADMTVGALVQSFLEKRPHLVKATGGDGGGARGGKSLADGTGRSVVNTEVGKLEQELADLKTRSAKAPQDNVLLSQIMRKSQDVQKAKAAAQR